MNSKKFRLGLIICVYEYMIKTVSMRFNSINKYTQWGKHSTYVHLYRLEKSENK